MIFIHRTPTFPRESLCFKCIAQPPFQTMCYDCLNKREIYYETKYKEQARSLEYRIRKLLSEFIDPDNCKRMCGKW